MSTLVADRENREESQKLTAEGLLRRRAQKRPDAIALADAPGGHGLARGGAGICSFAEADATVDALARVFIELGLKPGDRIAIQLPNVALQSITILAAWRAGLTVLMLPMLWRRLEIESVCALLAPKALLGACGVADENQAETLCTIAASHLSVRFVLGFGSELPDGVTSLDEALEAGLRGDAGPVKAAGLAGPAMITFTARAGAPLVPVFRHEDDLLAQGAMTVLALSLTSRDTILSPYPLTGAVGLGLGLMPWLISGGALALHHPFDYDRFVQQLIGSQVTVTALPASILAALADDGVLQAPDCKLARAGCVWSVAELAGGGTELDAAGIPLFDLYPLGDLVSLVHRREAGSDPGLIPKGKIEISGTDGARTVFLETALGGGSRALGLGPRDLLLRGPAVPHGETSSPLVPQAQGSPGQGLQGFVSSGLRAVAEGKGGDLLKVKRDPELLHHGGFSIAASELDALYESFPGFLDAASFMLPDPIVGDRIFAAVMPEPDQPVSLAALHDFLREKGVAPYKFPDRLVVVKTIPRNAHGALLRGQILREV
jgi:non-ribosomal peptide synthetase component E (peptide arylation enzyme)